jgi:hypothetical protein
MVLQFPNHTLVQFGLHKKQKRGEKMKTKLLFLSALLFGQSFALWSIAGQAESRTETDSMMNKRIADFTYTNITMRDVIQELRGKGGRVLFEEMGVQPQALTNNEDGLFYATQTLSVSLRDATVEQILKALIQASPTYSYSFHGSVDMVSVFPKTDSMLDWTNETIAVEKIALLSLVQGEEDILGLRRHNVHFSRTWVGRTEWLKTPITINQTNISVRECLAIICTNLPNMYYNASEIVGKRKSFGFCFVEPDTHSAKSKKPQSKTGGGS